MLNFSSSKLCLVLIAATTSLGLTASASATTISVTDTSRGAVSSAGAASTNNGTSTGNYIAASGTYTYNDYFVFSIPTLTGNVSAADLLLASGTVSGPMTFNLLSYSGSVSALSNPTAATYTALGSGTLLGTYTFTAAQSSGNIDIILNSAALAAIQAASGSQFVLAGTAPNANNYAFGFTQGVALSQLNVTTTPTPVATTPEPASLLLFGSGAFGLTGILRRRRS